MNLLKRLRPSLWYSAPSRAWALMVLALITCMLTLSSAHAAPAKTKEPEPRISVVATFSILGDIVREIGGGRIDLTTLVGPGIDAHTFEPTPKDVQSLASAQLLVLNGLGFEPWLPRLVDASGFKGVEVMASDGAKLRHVAGAGSANEASHGHKHEGGNVDPHAWLDLGNGAIYVRNIAKALSRVDPPGAAEYNTRADHYIRRLQRLDTEVRGAIASIPESRRVVIVPHDSFGYFAEAYGLRFVPIAGLSSKSEPSAKDFARIIDQAKAEGVAGVFVDNLSGRALAEQLSRETGAVLGGTLYSDALAAADEPAGTYVGLFSWNAGRLLYVLGNSPRREEAKTQ